MLMLYMAVGLLMRPKIIAMMAITSSTCISPPTEYINTPNAHPMMRITATIYNNEFMVDVFSGYLLMLFIKNKSVIIKMF